MANLFERLERSPPVEKAIEQPHKDPLPIEELLDWLVNHWAKDTVTMRNILQYGPNRIRDRKKIIDATEALVKNKWLVATRTRRRDMYEWLILRKPVLRPTIITKNVEKGL
jgi:hypothetical protein